MRSGGGASLLLTRMGMRWFKLFFPAVNRTVHHGWTSRTTWYILEVAPHWRTISNCYFRKTLVFSNCQHHTGASFFTPAQSRDWGSVCPGTLLLTTDEHRQQLNTYSTLRRINVQCHTIISGKRCYVQTANITPVHLIRVALALYSRDRSKVYAVTDEAANGCIPLWT
jgi:hypothetical protein